MQKSMTNKPVLIGITGVIGSGKSTVCKFLEKEFDMYWIEADKIAHELYEPGRPGYKKVKDYFGETFVREKGVHRGRLRQLITKSPQKIWILNKLMHPLIAHEVNKKIIQLAALNKGKKKTLICIEAVYFEANDLGRFVDQIFVIDAPEKVVLERLKERKIALSDLHIFYKFQKRNVPHNGLKILNDGSKEDLYKKVAEEMGKVLK